MDVEKNYKLAIELHAAGSPDKARELLLSGYPEVKQPSLRLNYILSLVILVDPVFELDKQSSLCDEGIKIATEIKNSGALSYLQMKKAHCYTVKSSEMLSIKKDITLAPNRISFALETDRDLYLSVTQNIEQFTKLTDQLVVSSFRLANAKDNNLFAHLYSMLADVYSARASQYLLENLRYAKILYKFRFLGLKAQHLLKRRAKRDLKKILSNAESAYLDSAKFYQKNNDSVGVACSFANLSNHLRTFGLYRRAKKYLLLSKKASNAKSITITRDQVELQIKDKNKNIPDYKQYFPRPVLRRNSTINLRAKLKKWFSNTE